MLLNNYNETDQCLRTQLPWYVKKNSNKVKDDYLPYPLQGEFSLEALASLDLGINLDKCMVYHLQSPCVEVPSPSSDHVEGFVV